MSGYAGDVSGNGILSVACGKLNEKKLAVQAKLLEDLKGSGIKWPGVA